MVRRVVAIGLLVGSGAVSLSCGDGPCPAGYVEKDEHCVPEAIADQCHLTGDSGVGEACAVTEDCHGCFVVCLEQLCVVQRDGGVACERDLECKSGRCEAGLCLSP